MNSRLVLFTLLAFSSIGNVKANDTVDSIRKMLEGTVDKFNTPVHELFDKSGACGEHVRWSKLALTCALAYMMYKQPVVKETVRKITMPIRCALCGAKNTEESRKAVVKKKVKDWSKD